MSAIARILLSLCFLLPAAGCTVDLVPGDGDDDADDPDDDLPPDPPPLPTVAIYRRGSLAPLFALTPVAEQNRIEGFGVNMSDSDFVTASANYVSVAQKLDEIANQIATERGTAVVPIVATADRLRAERMPFRGNPSDVEILRVGGERKIFVPLGGDMSVPGNEVAIVRPDAGTVTRIKVGVRPERVASHPDGLVFVCNHLSNYISIIDARSDRLLTKEDGTPVEVATDYNCADLVLVRDDGGSIDKQVLYVANPWRGSVLEYGLTIVRDSTSGRPIDVITDGAADDPDGNPGHHPVAEIHGVGSNPQRLRLSEDQSYLYAANGRGGEVARISLRDRQVSRRTVIGAPSMDVIQLGPSVFVPTTTPDRGLLSDDDPLPSRAQSAPVRVTGLDGSEALAHPGAMQDKTRAYNFEDIRNGITQLDFTLGVNEVYYTDDISPEAAYRNEQKVLTGALPIALERNAAGNRIFAAMSGSDRVQELEVVAGTFRLREVAGGNFATAQRPYAIAIDEAADELWVASWGGEVLQSFDLGNRQRKDTLDLGYANPGTAEYPATNIERGEFFFYNANWSNNGRKACASCHTDELITDGFGYSNGATAPTAYHQVRPNWNLMTTDNYFWNGSFNNGSYASLAFSAQTRTNCELIVFGLIEGPASDPDTRIGDPANRVTSGNAAGCRPEPVSADTRLPANFDSIAAIINNEKLIAADVIQSETGFSREEVSRFTDFYSVAELRLPPDPLTYLAAAGELGSDSTAQIERGQAVFAEAGCDNCHDPGNTRHPFTDGIEHGSGADWPQRFANRYAQDARIVLPDRMLNSLDPSQSDSEINIHTTLDAFAPLCFDAEDCLAFEDPLAVVGNPTEEAIRLELIDRFNLSDPERGFVPGNVSGQPKINTPSLRGVWWATNYLHHGLARSVYEAILAPGHPALREGEHGYAVNALGEIDVHGSTSELSAEDVEALILYLETIE